MLPYNIFKTEFGEEIRRIAKNTYYCSGISLKEFMNTKDDIKIYHDTKLRFVFIDNSKPPFYYEMLELEDGNYSVVYKEFRDRFKYLDFDYPYREDVTPARLIQDTVGLFGTGDYTYHEKTVITLPDYEKVEKLIYRVLEEFNIIN